MRRKNILAIGIAMLGIGTAWAQQSVNVVNGGVAYSFNTQYTGLMTYSDGTTLTILGNDFSLGDVEKIIVRDVVVDDNTVLVEYDGGSALVSIAGNLRGYVDAEVSGAHVVVNQDESVGDKTTGEITYILKGETSDGSLVFNGAYKCTIELQGVSISNPKGAAIDIENGKRVELSAKNGTVNNLTDGADGKQKAALYCKGHLELKGKGELNVAGNTGHAISAKEYIEMKNCTINITAAPKDGINCTQYFLMESGELNISGVEGDGIQVDYKDSASKREDDDTGSITIKGGTLSVTTPGVAGKCFKTEGDFIVSGGDITALASGPGEWDSSKLKTKASACVGADGGVTITGGTLALTATNGGGKGVNCSGEFVMDGGSLTITTTGGALVYSGGTLYQDYTGDLDRIGSDYKSSPKGIKCDDDVTIANGTLCVTTLGNNGEGIESKAKLTIDGGDITVRSQGDCINSDDDMTINGGKIDVISTNNDGLDSNSDLYITGGVVTAFGGRQPECGIDANDEDGYSVIITGGYVLGVGGGNSEPSADSGSTQAYVTTTASVAGGTEIVISDGEETLYTFTVPEDYTSSNNGHGPGGGNGGWGPGTNGGGLSILISTPELVSGESYSVKSGAQETTSTTARLSGTGHGPGGRP